MRKKKIAVIVLALAVMAAGLYHPITKVFAQDVYKFGSQGDVVISIQKKLKNWGYYTGVVDGVFGSGTKNAVIKFQQKNRLKVDGICGKQTLEAMGIFLKTGSQSGGSNYNATYNERILLAKAIMGEARGEPYIGQVAVGAVIMNRTRNASFPNSVAGVIYEPWAFTAVNDGQINLEPSASCLKAADDALNGWDPSAGSLYYWNPATATSQWIWTRQIKKVIGRHNFGV